MPKAPPQGIASSSFTTTYGGLATVLETEVHFCEPEQMDLRGPDLAMISFRGIWDTGASRSVVSEDVVQKLGLKPIDTTTTYTANGTRKACVYLVSVGLPNRLVIPLVQVTDGDIFGTDALIGMDIIQCGDFALTHQNGQTRMTFSMPATRNIDFVKEENTKAAHRGSRSRHPTKKGPGRKRRR